jgi:hypothetical protein
MPQDIKDPILHSHIEDVLPEDHPDAYKTLSCVECNRMIHAINNECMQTWIESGKGNFCLKCFACLPEVEALDIEYGLAK